MSGISSQLQTHLSTITSLTAAENSGSAKAIDNKPKYQEIADNIKTLVSGQSSLSPEVSATLLNLIDKLEKAGIEGLGQLKTQVATLTNKPDIKAPVPQAAPGPVPAPKDAVLPSGPKANPIAPGAILGDIIHEEDPMAAKAQTFISTIVPEVKEKELLAAIFDLGNEVFKSVQADFKAKGKDDFGTDDLNKYTNAYFDKIFADMPEEDLKALASALSAPKLKDLLCAYSLKATSLCSSFDIVEMLSGMRTIQGTKCYGAIIGSLNDALQKRNIAGQYNMNLPTQVETTPEINDKLSEFMVMAGEKASKLAQDDLKELLPALCLSGTKDEACQHLADYFGTFPAGVPSLPDFKAFLKNKLESMVKGLSDEALKGLLTRFNTTTLNNLAAQEFSAPQANTPDAIATSYVKIFKNIIENEEIRRHPAVPVTKRTTVYGLESIDYTVPSFSKWENFKRAISNFFGSIFNSKRHLTLGDEQLAFRAKEFGKKHGSILTRLHYEGFHKIDVRDAIAAELTAKNPDMPAEDVQKLATLMTEDMVAGAKEWRQETFGLKGLPDGDLRGTISAGDMTKLAKILDLSPVPMSPEAEANLREQILLDIKDAAAKPGFSPQTMKDIAKAGFERALAVERNRQLGLIPPEPEKLETADEIKAYLLSAASQNIPDIGKFFNAASKLKGLIDAQINAAFRQKRLTKPDCAPPGGDDFSRAYGEAFEPLIASLNDKQLILLAKMVNSPEYNIIYDAPTSLMQDLNGRDIYGTNAYLMASNVQQIMGFLHSSVRAEVEKRHIDAGVKDFSLKAQVESESDIPSRFKEPIKTFTLEMQAAAHTEFTKRMDGILETIINGNIGQFKNINNAGELVSLLTELRKLTYTNSSQAQGLKEFDTFFNQILNEALQKMAPEDLLRLVSGLHNPALTELRIALTNHHLTPLKDGSMPAYSSDANLALDTLNNLEAAVYTLIADRAIDTTPVKDSRLTGANVAVLAGAEHRSAQVELGKQSDDYLKTGDASKKKDISDEAQAALDANGITKEDFQKVIDSSNLTINLSGELLFGETSPFRDENGKFDPSKAKLKNIFELEQHEKGTHYVAKRIDVEHKLTPELKTIDADGIKAKAHPISAALNVGKSLIGAVPLYSQYDYCCIVLKDNVKKRTTFTAGDSFYAFEQIITDSGNERFRTALNGLKNGQPFTLDHPEVITDDFIEYVISKLAAKKGQAFGNGHDGDLEMEISTIITNYCTEHHATVSLNDEAALVALAIMNYSQGDAFAPTSADHMNNLLPKLHETVLETIKTRSQDPYAINCAIAESSYIEGQIYGGVDLTKDIKEIRVLQTRDKAKMARAKEVADKLGVPLVIVKENELDITTTRVDLKPVTPPQEVATKDASFKAFKKEFFNEIMDIYKNHEQTFDPESLHGRAHISRVVIYANAMINYMEAQGMKIDRYGLIRAIALHDAGRLQNGPDVYEGRSGDKLKEHLRAQGITDEAYIEKMASLINGKLPIDTVEAMILHSCDSIDIVRVTGSVGFDRTRLPFGRDGLEQSEVKYNPDNDVREAFIAEAKLLNDMCDPLKEAYDILEQANAIFNDPDATQEQLNHASDLNEAATAKMLEISANTSNEDYFTMFEKTVLDNPDKFPLLNKYYKVD